MLKKVTWRFWTATAVLVAAWIGLGFAWSHNGPVESDIYKAGLVAWFLSPLVFIVIWTAMGKKWWLNDVGVNLVLVELAGLVTAGPLAYALIFRNGELTSPWWGWAEIAGPLVTALLLAWRNVIWLRQQRTDKEKP